MPAATCVAERHTNTIIPDLGNSADFDRYAYVRNNPLRFIDPSGHIACGRDAGMLGGCTREEDPFTEQELKDAIKYDYGIPGSITSELSHQELEDFYYNPLEFLMNKENRETLLDLEELCKENPHGCHFHIHGDIHWEEFTYILPVIDLAKMGLMTIALGAFSIAFLIIPLAACETPLTCVVAYTIALPAAGAAGVGSYLLGKGTYMYFMKEFYEFEVRYE